MKIVDASSARIWRMERAKGNLGAEASRESRHYHGVSQRIGQMYPTVTPADSNYYAEGRDRLKVYVRGFVDIREYTYHHSAGLRSARMTDADIEALIIRMNLSHR